MYPFNQAVSLAVEEETATCTDPPLEERSIMTNILEMSSNDDQWVKDLRRRRQSNGSILTTSTWRGVTCVSRCLRPVLVFLRLVALFPGVLDKRRGIKNQWRRRVKYFFLVNMSILAVLFNTYLVNLNYESIMRYERKFGLMHASTVSAIITGIKPLINIFIISLFTLRIKQHLRLLKTLDTVDVCFRSAFHFTPPIKLYKYVFFFFAFIGFMFPCGFKAFEFLLTGDQFGMGLVMDFAFLIVPMLTIWNILPLMYYDMCNRIVRFYCRTLIRSLNKEHRMRHFSLKFYYAQFLRITNVQEAIGELFNPFILLSLAWSMMVLCLTIYFITLPHSSLIAPITEEQLANEEIRNIITLRVHMTMCWAGLQVLVAVLHISTICYTGMKTNEMTRSIVNVVLRIVPNANADLDRFQISCFVHKMTTQFMWGMTVWRAFPLERTTFFTLVSVIVTYSFLLLKLKENPAVMPITHSIIINGTYAQPT